MVEKRRYLLNEQDVLRYYQSNPRKNSTIRPYYLRWRERQNCPEQCDQPGCITRKEPLVWNGKPLPLILDHINGDNHDCRAENLQLVCPNCSVQLPTHSGKNIGRIHNREGRGVELKNQDGTIDVNVHPPGAEAETHASAPMPDSADTAD